MLKIIEEVQAHKVMNGKMNIMKDAEQKPHPKKQQNKYGMKCIKKCYQVYIVIMDFGYLDMKLELMEVIEI